MKKYTFISSAIFADSEDEAWDKIQERFQDNEITDCLACLEEDITFEDFKQFNPLGLNKDLLANLTEENLKEYLEELE